jgi:xanthine dehydrogenase accessory factor
LTEHRIADHAASELIIEAARRLDCGERFALVTVIGASGSSPRKTGARMLVEHSGVTLGSVGGGAVERIAVERALTALQTGATDRIELDLDDVEHLQTGMVCGGRMELLIESFGAGPRLLIFGAGHVAAPTAKLALGLGFAVTVHDSRSEWLSPDRFPGIKLMSGSFTDLASALSTTSDDYIAVMTPCHDDDYAVITQLLRKPFFYLGVIGSKRKAVEIRKRLRKDGFKDDEIKRLTCPIGLNIGSHTPEEIAVAVAAQLISLRRDWENAKAGEDLSSER